MSSSSSAALPVSASSIVKSLPSVLSASMFYLSMQQHEVLVNHAALHPFIPHLPCWVPMRDIALLIENGVHEMRKIEDRIGFFVWAPEFANIHTVWRYEEKDIIVGGVAHRGGSEVYFQLQKSVGTQSHAKCVATMNALMDRRPRSEWPLHAWKVGRQGEQQARWEDEMFIVMKRAVRAKFADHSLRLLLISTRNHPLVYTKKEDKIWGSGENGAGANVLGRLLTEFRSDITSASSASASSSSSSSSSSSHHNRRSFTEMNSTPSDRAHRNPGFDSDMIEEAIAASLSDMKRKSSSSSSSSKPFAYSLAACTLGYNPASEPQTASMLDQDGWNIIFKHCDIQSLRSLALTSRQLNNDLRNCREPARIPFVERQFKGHRDTHDRMSGILTVCKPSLPRHTSTIRLLDANGPVTRRTLLGISRIFTNLATFTTTVNSCMPFRSPNQRQHAMYDRETEYRNEQLQLAPNKPVPKPTKFTELLSSPAQFLFAPTLTDLDLRIMCSTNLNHNFSHENRPQDSMFELPTHPFGTSRSDMLAPFSSTPGGGVIQFRNSCTWLEHVAIIPGLVRFIVECSSIYNEMNLPRSIFHVLYKNPTIRIFHCKSSWKVVSPHFRFHFEALESMPKLRELSWSAPFHAGVFLKEARAHAPNLLRRLTSLNLPELEPITLSVGDQTWSTAMPNLRELRIGATHNILMFPQFTQLTVLRCCFDGTANVDTSPSSNSIAGALAGCVLLETLILDYMPPEASMRPLHWGRKEFNDDLYTTMLTPLTKLRVLSLFHYESLDSLAFLERSGRNETLEELRVVRRRTSGSDGTMPMAQMEALRLPRVHLLLLDSVFLTMNSANINLITPGAQSDRFPSLKDVRLMCWCAEHGMDCGHYQVEALEEVENWSDGEVDGQ